MAQAGQDIRRQASARTSINSLLRSAKCLFSPKVLKHLGGLELPSPLPFSQLDFEPKQNVKYKGTFDADQLIQEARAELPDEQLKAFLLAIGAGLRRAEIDYLEWNSFLWDKNAIRIQATRYWSPKTAESSADVLVDPELMEVFTGVRARAADIFVIESERPPQVSVRWHQYRCKRHFQKLTAWLRAKGVPKRAPLHCLRKEYGSMICKFSGIYSASAMLRHSNLQTTVAHYVDHRTQSVLKIGHYLKAAARKSFITRSQFAVHRAFGVRGSEFEVRSLGYTARRHRPDPKFNSIPIFVSSVPLS